MFSSHLFWTSGLLDAPAGVTQEEGHTGLLIHFPSAVLALIFLARSIQPFLSLVHREVEFRVLTIKWFSTVGHFFFFFFFFSYVFFSKGKIPVTGIRTHVPTCQKVSSLPTELPGRQQYNVGETYWKLFLFHRLQRQNLFMAFSINNCRESAGTLTVIHGYLRYGM